MRRFLLWTTTAAAALALPAVAMAAVPGFAVNDVDLHAGPGGVYPVVDTLPAGARLRIDGCIGRYAWCNVSWRGEWGWVPADELQALYRGRRVVVVDYGPEIGLPIIGFSVDSYWHRHYRDRGFYARIHQYDRGRYAHGAVGVSGRNATVGTGPNATVGTGRNATVGTGRNATVGTGARQNRHGTAGVNAPNATRNGATIRNAAPQTGAIRNNEAPRAGANNRSLRNAPAANVNAAPAHPRETTGAAPHAEFGGRGAGGGAPAHAAPAAPAPAAAPAPSHGAPGGGGHGGPGGDHRH